MGIIIRATRTREVLGEKGRRIRELTSAVQKRFRFPENSVELFAERVENRAANAMAQAESLRYKLIGGLAVRRACYGVVRFIMENGCTGCEVVVSGKLRAQRAKAMKFKDGYLISTGDPKNYYIDEAVRHVAMRQGMLGVRVKIMLKHDPEGKTGPKKPMPDLVIVHEPKPEATIVQEEETTYADVDTAPTSGYDGAGGSYTAGGAYSAGGGYTAGGYNAGGYGAGDGYNAGGYGGGYNAGGDGYTADSTYAAGYGGDGSMGGGYTAESTSY